MTRVNFYQIHGGFEATLSLACRLAEKAYKQRIDALLFCPDVASATQLNDLLWQHGETSFVPHQLIAPQDPEIPADNSKPAPALAPGQAPVGITWGQDVAEYHGMLINLVTETPSWFSRFEALAEIVNSDPAEKELKRVRYSFYRDRGYPLSYHNVDKAPSSENQTSGNQATKNQSNKARTTNATTATH